MQLPAATLRSHPTSLRSGARLEPVGAWVFGFLLVALLAGHDGGFFPAAWAWTAFATWLLTAVLVALRPRVALGALDLTMVGAALAFAAWFALSALWSRSVPSTLDESFRYLAYAGIVVAALLVVERAAVPHLLGGVTAAITLLSAYALGTRVLPDRLGEFASIFGYRLSGTIGYWNGLGIFAVVGLLLALGFAARGERPATRALAGAALPVLAATMYFTFSRGAWLALVAGLIAALAVDTRRLQLAFAGALLGIPPAAAVVLASRAGGLTQAGASYTSAVHDGHRFAPLVVLLAVLSAGTAILLRLGERRFRVPPALRLVWAGTIVAVLLAGAGGVWLRNGSPPQLARRAWEQAQARPQAVDNTGRLYDLSSNGRRELWRVAWDTFSEHPAAGVGGGSYWQVWVASPRGSLTSTEAHSVYVETLAELGVAGLVVLLLLLAPPFLGAVRARRSPLVPFALGAYVGWVVHAGVDWDWELIGVSAAPVLCGAVLVAAGRGRPRGLHRGVRAGAVVAASVLVVVSMTSVLALARLDAAEAALGRGDFAAAAADARRARRFAPWSTHALELTAAARLGQGRLGQARDTYREIARRDPRSWIAWAHLADVSSGAERAHAISVTRSLNPLFRSPPR